MFVLLGPVLLLLLLLLLLLMTWMHMSLKLCFICSLSPSLLWSFDVFPAGSGGVLLVAYISSHGKSTSDGTDASS
ncbi:uncharacterized protein F5Z01DRAFT_642609 [Emericellopsis atlantica]|uniref:Uncharacterized protein n=1 Tax=Emericellopsis atlantica TaxID=2614577 RepID=A0A9P8CUJ6_9HYPO|nr:uncharacterized protein F5Z01DRAFT_642609 [Emericellopsis atlantica]KAG9259212.1 hypothetical protein F5Z01DRAFT_642609 [Emericellopsis atlantica]